MAEDSNSSSTIPGDEALLHPALVGAALRHGRIGRPEASATLARLIGRGFVLLKPTTYRVRRPLGRTSERTTYELTLLPPASGGGAE